MMQELITWCEIAAQNGKNHAETHDYREAPLSGEWAGEITTGEVIMEVEEEAGLGTIPADLESEILDSWEAGYWEFWDEYEEED